MAMAITHTTAVVRAAIAFRKVGGLYHWRIGRLGGSVYLARR